LTAGLDRVSCVSCGATYPIRDGILDLRPASTDAHKQRQAEFFSSEAEGYERDVVNSPFYRALDALTVARWAASLPPASLVLDIGSGTGRVAIALAAQGHRVIAMDLTEPLLRRARVKALDAGVAGRIDFILADAETLPVADGTLDAAVAHGVLHHLERPDRLIAAAARALRPGGFWFSLDPHKSPARGLFDAAMRRRPLWQEEAAPDAMQTESRLRDWCEAAGIEPRFGYSCYVLPHLMTPLPQRTIQTVLGTTDALFGRSVLRKFAGVIYVAGRRRPVAADSAPTAAGRGRLLLVLLALAALSGIWRADPTVAAQSGQYYMGGLGSMLSYAENAARNGVTLIDERGNPLEESTLDDVGYMVAVQIASVAGIPMTGQRLAAAHAIAYAIAATLFAWAVGVRYHSNVAALAILGALIVLGSRLSMLIYGQVSNQSITSAFAPLSLAALLLWSGHLHETGSRRALLRHASLGALVGAIDLVRHSHGLAIILTIGLIVALAIHGLRARGKVMMALAAGYLVITILFPAALKLQRDLTLNRWQGQSVSYLQRPPAHHIWYTLLTAVGRYPNALGLFYEDGSVDGYITRHAPQARGESARVDQARGLMIDYVKAHPWEYAKTLAAGATELGPFVGYVTFMAPKRWELAWPSIVAGVPIEPHDIGRYGKDLLMNVKLRYLRLDAWQWALFGAAWAALLGAAGSVLFAGTRDVSTIVIGSALLYLVCVALPRALIPVQGMDFVFAFWCVALLAAVHLAAGGPRSPLRRAASA
jgi:ubiquinone/menaquinone biosynthesis C-methylase UbiE